MPDTTTTASAQTDASTTETEKVAADVSATTTPAADTTAPASKDTTKAADASASTDTDKAAASTASAETDKSATDKTPSDKTETPATETKGVWADDWRQQLAQQAGLDEKAAKRLDRFASPADIFKALRAVESKVGEMKKALPENPTPEDLAAYRKENGIPENPEGYPMPEGVVIGEDDKPIVQEFLKDMHGVNAPPAAVKSALGAYVKAQQYLAADLDRMDSEFKDKAEEELRAEWGGEYKKNLTLVNNWLETAPKGLKENLLNGRLANGNKISDDPAMQRFLVGVVREVNPVSTILPGAGQESGAALESRIGEIKKLMRDRSSEYFTGPKEKNGETKLSNEYRSLLTMQERMKGKAA